MKKAILKLFSKSNKSKKSEKKSSKTTNVKTICGDKRQTKGSENGRDVLKKQKSLNTLRPIEEAKEKTPNRRSCDVKSFKEEMSRRIELVGNHFRSANKSKAKLFESSLNEENENKSMNSMANEIELKGNRESNTHSIEFKVIQSKENLLKTENQEERLQTHNDDHQREVMDNVAIDSNTSKTTNDSVIHKEDLIGSDTQSKSSPQNTSHTTPKSGMVCIKDIDLQRVKCILCEHSVCHDMNITICCHIFCSNCLNQWLRYSQHCPQCRTLMTSFAHSIRIGLNNQIDVRSEDDYKVSPIHTKRDNFVDSLCACYLFEAFCLNRENTEYLESNIEGIEYKVSHLESTVLPSVGVQRKVVIQYTLYEQKLRLEELRRKKNDSEESFKHICCETQPQMLDFWRQLIQSRNHSIFI